ncbi:hypothetical protein C8Q74DRAFT_1368544 [Fomes fomentarius]|nr:hypothetical protein C8Q74DRAFT_1368544 [Fomes fomentarius]
MPLSVGGGQLPISAFFGSSVPSSTRTSKTGNPSRISPGKRKDPPAAPDQHTEPPKKKAKQKENLAPSKRGSSLNFHESEYLEDGTRSQARRSPGGKPTGGEKTTGDVAQNSEGGNPLSTVVDDSRTNIAWGSSPSNPTHAEPNDHQSPLNVLARLDTPPLTPVRIECRRDVLSSNSLPSPPLTAPNSKRPRKMSDAEVSCPAGAALQPALYASPDAPFHPPSSSGTASERRDKDPFTALQPQSSREFMPPPPLPLKVPLPPAMSTPTFHYRKPSSEDWVPSSQTQELCIPGDEDSQDAPLSGCAARTVSDYASQVVPSSQSQERELEIPHSQPVNRLRTSLSPLRIEPPARESHANPAGTDSVDNGGEMPSPEIVESSQSQIEVEITQEWAAIIGSRLAEFRGGRSTPSREPTSQGYDAQDEYSSDSQPSVFSLSDIRTSPLRAPSQWSESSASYDSDSQPTAPTPPQVRRFRDMFKGRDEYGNMLPENQRTDPDHPPSSSSVVGEGYDALEDTSILPPRIPKSPISDDSSSYSSGSYHPVVEKFLNMFSDSEPLSRSDNRTDSA